MKILRSAEQMLVDYEKHKKTNTMARKGGTSLEWLMYHAAATVAAAAAAAGDGDGGKDGRDKGERVEWQRTMRMSKWWCCVPN
jgi:hypothetical protein